MLTSYLNKLKTHHFKKELKLFFIANIATLSLALSINLLAWQFRLSSGGISGYCLTLSYLTNIPVGVYLFGINGFILLLNVLLLNKLAGFKAIYGYVSFSVLVELTRLFLNLEQHSTPHLALQYLLILLLAASIAITVGVIVACSYSVGSYSAIYPVINKFYNISFPKLMLLLDLILIITTAFLFGISYSILLLTHSLTTILLLRYTLKYSKKLFKI